MTAEKLLSVAEEVEKVILGKKEQVREVLTAMVAGGNILMDDIPGVGKTTLALCFAEAFCLEHRRIQFTSDIMPSDLTGFSVFVREKETFAYKPGPVFCNLLLADEVNRTSPRTQSALLEVMEEHKVTVDGVTRRVPEPFTVIATQNPYGSIGTQMLPDSQVDRFMVSLSMGYPDRESEILMAKAVGEAEKTANIRGVMSAEELAGAIDEASRVYMADDVYSYIVSIVGVTRGDKRLAHGASPRATIAFVKTARASALLDGRDFVIPRDVEEQAAYVLSHRLRLSAASGASGADVNEIISEIVSGLKKPAVGE